MERLSAFNNKINQHYWMVKSHLPPHQGMPCFTRDEMRNFEEMRPDEIRLVFKMRLDGVEIAWPRNWRMFRLQEQISLPDREGAKRAAEILAMLRSGCIK